MCGALKAFAAGDLITIPRKVGRIRRDIPLAIGPDQAHPRMDICALAAMSNARLIRPVNGSAVDCSECIAHGVGSGNSVFTASTAWLRAS
jgi:hypothetical protein